MQLSARITSIFRGEKIFSNINTVTKGRDSRKQIVIFKKVTTFFNFEDMFRCYKHHRQLQNI